MATATPVDTPVESSVVVDSKQTYCFSDLVSLSASVPFRVRFITSDAQVSAQLSHNTIMDVYAIQRSNAAVLCRHCDQQQIKYIMPFESSFKCSPIYNPNNNIKEAMRGYKYNSISELQQANPQPLAVNVTIGYLDTDDTSASMETGDTYVIKNSMKPSGSGELAVDEDVLVCEDAVTHQYKHLHYTSTCFLNTTPSNLLLKPSDFFLSLSPPADILIHNLPSSIIPAATSGASSSAVFTVTKILPLLTISTHILSKTVILDIYGHEELPAEVELVQDVPPLEYQQMKLRAELESMTSTNETREDCISVVFMTDDNDCTTSKALSFTDGLQKLFLCSKQFNDRDDYLLKLHSATIVKTTPQLHQAGQYNEENKRILQSYSVTEVCELLVQLGLKQSREAFAREKVTGKILADITDDMLKHKLGMTRKLDRIKIQVIQQGTKSIEEVMKVYEVMN